MGNLSESHPLQQLFTELVNRNYEEALGRNDNELNSYVASMLCEFCDSDQLFQIRKPIGDVALFFTGMFPESINHQRLRRARIENFIDFMKAGKESYYIVSKFEFFEYAKVAPLFARLAENFEACVHGLNLVRGDLQDMQHPIIGRYKERRDDIVM